MVTLPLSFLISLRFICSGQHRNRIVTVVSIVSIIGITLGVAVLVIGFSAMNGFKRELNNRILAIVPHGEIESVKQPWKNWNETLRKIQNVPGITAEPYINFIGLIESKANISVIQIKAINPQEEERFSSLPKFVKNSAWKYFKANEQQIIIGNGVADVLNIKQGDWISITFSNSRKSYKLQKPKRIRLHVTGILQLNSQIDRNFALLPIQDARKYLNMENSITGIAIKTNDVLNANKKVFDIGMSIDDYVHIKSWIGTYGYIYHDIQMISVIMYLAMILLIGIACFNIVSTLITAVKVKRSDIAILYTMGAKDRFIRTIFIWYGLLSGIISSLLGVFIGVVISLQLTSIFSSFEKLIKHTLFPRNIYFINFLPSEVHWIDIIYVTATTILISVLATWYPACHASRINPAEILKLH